MFYLTYTRGRTTRRPNAYLRLQPSCYMSQHLFHCRTRPGGVLLAFARRGLFVLGLVRLSETLCVILRGS